MTTLFVQGNSRVINVRVGDVSLVFMIKKVHLNVFPIFNADRLMTAYDLGQDDWRDMGNKSKSYLINATSKFTLHEIALNLHGPVLKACFRKSHTQPKCISLLRCKTAGAACCYCRWLFLMPSAHPKYDQTIRLASKLSRCVPLLSSIPIEKNPTVLSLETWLVNCGDTHAQSIAQRNDR